MNQAALEVQDLSQQELERYLYWQAQLIAPDTSNIQVKPEMVRTEIDSVPEVFGTLYRV